MKVRRVVEILTVVAFAAFVARNWAVISAPSQVSVFLFDLNIPIGVVLLALLVLAVLVFATYVLTLKTQMLMEMRRVDKALSAQREIADQAEASRIAALEALVRSESGTLRGLIESLGQSLDAGEDGRFNGLYAHLGQIDDKLDRVIGNRN